jgi:diacylglycerol O-acyltransferase-1
MATLVVFLFSALMHEVAISLPFRHISFHAFFGMLAQAPLISVAKYIDRTFDNAFLGNALFWCTFCIVGQPVGVIMYYYDLSKLALGVVANTVGMGHCTDAGAVCSALLEK